MDIEVAIKLVDKLYFQNTNQYINSVQINLLRGVWSNESYEEIARLCYCSVSNIKIVGAAFWKDLSQILGEKVTKKTVRTILEAYYEDLKTGKLRKVGSHTEINHNLYSKANERKIIQSVKKTDPWFAERLLQLTKKLDDSLKTIDHTSNTDVSIIKSLSEKLQLIHYLSTQKYSFNHTTVDIIKICRHLINDFQVNFPNRTIILSLFEEPILSHYDVSLSTLINEKLVHNILNNLLSNALQYSNIDSTITLDINVEDEKGFFTVIDEGIGIPSDELEQVFKPFYCGSNAFEKSGDGLGLTIVEKSVRLHQGEISLSSQIKKGSIFTVTLPVV